jgi:mono/diheme cytochrome c family protein
MKKIIFISFFSLTIAAACHKKAVPEITSRTEFPPAPKSKQLLIENSPEAIAAGNKIFETRCNRCHDLKTVEAYTPERWTSILQIMIPRARLDEEQAKQLTSYVMANAKK